MAEPGAVAWQFERKGVVLVAGAVDEDELMLAALDAGAEDIADDGDDVAGHHAPPTDLHAVRTGARGGGHRRSSRPTLTMVADQRRAARHAPRRPRRCCGSSTRSRTTTTCRTSTPTSTSPTTILEAVEA